MSNLDPMKVVLSVVDPKYPKDIPVEEISKDEKLLKSAIKLAERNGLYYCFVHRLIELNPDLALSDEEQERWDNELQKLPALKNTFTFLNEMQLRDGIDYILIKACTSIPHLPRDVDILVRIEDKDRIYDIFKSAGMEVVYSNPVETAFNKEGYMKLDIYSGIEYVGVNFIDSGFLWDSKVEVEDEMIGVKYPSLNDEANFLLLLVHSIFGHRSMSLLDFLHTRSLMADIQDIGVCRGHAYERGWGVVFDMGLERLKAVYETIYKDDGVVPFPYLFDRKFMVGCVASMEGLYMNKREEMFFSLSLGLDRVAYELARSPFYDYLMAFGAGRRMFNYLGYFVRARRGDRHGIHGNGKIKKGGGCS
jgi:hypothetical protein